VQTYQINIAHGRENVYAIRRELFAFSEILDVFAAGRADSLVVVCVGRPRLGEWLRALRAVGYEVPARRHLSDPTIAVHRMSGIHDHVSQIAQTRRPHAA
jgi:hypothetical protein